MQLSEFSIGCVSYFNARPLCLFPEEAQAKYLPPSQLATLFNQGQLDVALLPVFELFKQSQPMLVDGIAIACDGPVRSVLVAYREPLEQVKEIWLDPASRTSNHLAQVLFSQYLKQPIEWKIGHAPGGAAQVKIGDPALHLREEISNEKGWKILDLGETWKAFTGLPFVFAVWVIAPHVANRSELADLLRKTKTWGMSQRSEIAKSQSEFPDMFLLEYLTEVIRYDLRGREKQGLGRFQELLKEEGFLEKVLPLQFF